MELHSRRLVLAPFIAVLLVLGPVAAGVEAATIVVNSAVDDPNDGACSLNEAQASSQLRQDIGGCAHAGEFAGPSDVIVIEPVSTCVSTTAGLCADALPTIQAAPVAPALNGLAPAVSGAAPVVVVAPAFTASLAPSAGTITVAGMPAITAMSGAVQELLEFIAAVTGSGFTIQLAPVPSQASSTPSPSIPAEPVPVE
jgi:hypothetical protein